MILQATIRDIKTDRAAEMPTRIDWQGHATYVRLAQNFACEQAVALRPDELSAAEAEIIDAGEPLPRMHS